MVTSNEEITKELERKGLGFTVCPLCEEVLPFEESNISQTSDLLCPGDGALLVRCPTIGEPLVGDYLFLGLIGVGGMGGVFRCRHSYLDKTVAVKRVLVDSVSENEKLRLQREARVLSKLQHKSLVTVFDFGFDPSGRPYLAMEYVEGQNLAQIVKQERLSLEECLSIIDQCLAGLDCAHRAGVIHRDVKLSNIMVMGSRPNYELKILDFGIAKTASGSKSLEAQSLTASGQVFGSPLYMSPEQALGRAIDARTDLYSLGCVLFEMLFGHPPFQGANAMDTIFKHANEPLAMPDYTVGGEVLPASLRQLLMSLLAKEVSARPRSARDCQLALAKTANLKQSSALEVCPPGKNDGLTGDLLESAVFDSPRRLGIIFVPIFALAGIFLISLLLTRTGSEHSSTKAGAVVPLQSISGSTESPSGRNRDANAGGEKESLLPVSSAEMAAADKVLVARLIKKHRSENNGGTFVLRWLLLRPDGIDELNNSGRDLLKLELQNCQWTESGVLTKLSLGTRSCLGLRELDDLNDTQFQQLCRIRGLRKLTLQDCPLITSRGLLGLKELQAPVSIELSKIELSQADLNQFLPIPSLQFLFIEPRKYGLAPGWLGSLVKCKSLCKLTLRRLDLRDYDLGSLHSLTSLGILDLEDCSGVTPALLKNLHRLPGLYAVSLSGSDASPDAVRTLLLSCPRVKVYFKDLAISPNDVYLNQAVKSGRLSTDKRH